mgnify:CR=1 FL=1
MSKARICLYALIMTQTFALAYYEEAINLPPGLDVAVTAAQKQRADFFWPAILTTGLLTARLAVDGLVYEYFPLLAGSEWVDIAAFDFSALCYTTFISNTPSLEENTLAEIRTRRLSQDQQFQRLEGLKVAGSLDRYAKAAACLGLAFYFISSQTANSQLLDQVLAAHFFNLSIHNFKDLSPAELAFN